MSVDVEIWKNPYKAPATPIDKEVEFYLFWRQRYQNDLGYIWLTEQLLRAIL